MLLFVDTETSGLLRPDLPTEAPEQPHLVQLGAQLFDGQYRRRAALNLLIKPDGWEIEPQAEAVHGITTQACHRYGVTLAEALVPLRGLVNAAVRVAAHNMEFDRKVIAAAIYRAGGSAAWWKPHKLFCTMEAATDVCALPAQFGSAKFPSLAEAVSVLCGRTIVQQHDAEADIAETVAVYRELERRGVVHAPRVVAL